MLEKKYLLYEEINTNYYTTNFHRSNTSGKECLYAFGEGCNILKLSHAKRNLFDRSCLTLTNAVKQSMTLNVECLK